MPELPEVQTIVNDLNKKVLGRRIIGAWFDRPKMITLRQAQGNGEQGRTIKKPRPVDFEKQIKGLKITAIKRRGKNILIYLKPKTQNLKPKLLLIHQKMTGHLLYGSWKFKRGAWMSEEKGPLSEKVNNYIHLMFYLDDGRMLALSDLRKFAKVLFGPREEIENLPDLKKIGPEPLDKNFNFTKFQSLIKKEKRKIKQVLMDQEVIAGIGNIYSDEILWQAKIHPFKPADKLTSNELKKIYLATRQILKKAVKLRGTSTSDYRDTAGKPGAYTRFRFVYQREGEPCRRCQTRIKRVKIGSRSAHYCPACQRLN